MELPIDYATLRVIWWGLLGVLFIVFAPALAAKAGLYNLIGGAIIGAIGLMWSSYTATHDNLGLRVLCRFVPLLGEEGFAG